MDRDEKENGILRRICIAIFVVSYALFAGCSSKQEAFFAAALGLGEPMIIVSGGGIAASTNTTVTAYDSNGNFLRMLANYGATSENPRGLAMFDPFNLLVAIEGTDRIEKISLFGPTTPFAVNPNFTGNIFGMTKDSSGNYYVAESNTIERFDSTGSKFPTGATPYIGTTIGGCTLNTPHGLTINSSGRLVAVNSGNSTITIYNISGATATCVSSTTVAGSGLWDVIQHPNGYLYMVSQTTDAIYRANPDGSGSTLLYQYTPNTVNPGAIAVLPNGNLIVATHGTNQVDLFSESGTLLRSAFIRNSATVQVNSLLVVGGQ